MNLPFGRSMGHWNGRVAPRTDASEFAEVVYETNEVLVVSVAAVLAEDTLLADALMDVIATSGRCETAELAIESLAAELDLDVRRDSGRGEHHLTIVPPRIRPRARVGGPPGQRWTRSRVRGTPVRPWTAATAIPTARGGRSGDRESRASGPTTPLTGPKGGRSR